MTSWVYWRDLLRVLIVRELRVRYKRSALGLLWAVLSPLGTVLTLHLVFTRVIPLGIPNYASFIYAGLLPWMWFNVTLHTSAAAFRDNRDLVRTPFFSRVLLPAAIVGTQFLLYLAGIPVLLLLLAAEGTPVAPTIALLPLVWVVQVVLAVSLSLFVAVLGILIPDVQHLLAVVLTLWFYLTPVFYDINRVQSTLGGWLAFNPMTTIVSAHRSLLLYHEQPDWFALILLGAIGCAALVCAFWLFRFLEDTIVEEV